MWCLAVGLIYNDPTRSHKLSVENISSDEPESNR